jgi:hypothetical protein
VLQKTELLRDPWFFEILRQRQHFGFGEKSLPQTGFIPDYPGTCEERSIVTKSEQAASADEKCRCTVLYSTTRNMTFFKVSVTEVIALCSSVNVSRQTVVYPIRLWGTVGGQGFPGPR